MCPENYVERGTQRGTLRPGLRTTETKENRAMPTQIDGLTDRVIRNLELECVGETLFDDEAISEQSLAFAAYMKAGGAK